MRRRSRFVGNGEENAAAEGSFQSKPPEYTAVAKPFPKEICEPARRKILDQAKFLSKGRVAGCGTASHGFNQFLKSKSFCPFSVLCLYKQHTVFSAGIIDIYKTLYAFFFCKSIKIFPRVGMQIFMRVYNFP